MKSIIKMINLRLGDEGLYIYQFAILTRVNLMSHILKKKMDTGDLIIVFLKILN